MHNGITVRDVMNREFVGVSESDTLEDAAELMQTESTEAVVVLRGADPIGTLSTATALGALLDDGSRTQPVGEIMEPPVPTIEPDAVLSEAIQQFVDRGAPHLLVVDDEIVGLLTERDVLAASETVDATAVASRPTEDEQTDSLESTTPAEPGGGPEQSIQGICEGCGSLTPELTTVNGQLVCPACRAY